MASLRRHGPGAAGVLKHRRTSTFRRKTLLQKDLQEPRKDSVAFHKLDLNNDGVVDMEEFMEEAKKGEEEEPAVAHKVTADGNPEELTGKDMIEQLEEKLRLARANRFNYLGLCYFLCYVTIYLFVLTEQRATLQSFQVEEALKVALFSETTNTLELYSGEISENLDSVSHIWNWINRSLIHGVFTDPICGDGTCDVPQEFEQWESHGCAEDCGSVPRSKMTNLFVEVTAHFEKDAELAAASWNLCSPTHALCLYPTARTFSALNETQVVEVWLPDGVWEVTVDARNGGVSGRVYSENSTIVTYYVNETDSSSDGSFTNCSRSTTNHTSPTNRTNSTENPSNFTGLSNSTNSTLISSPLNSTNITNTTTGTLGNSSAILSNSTNSTNTTTLNNSTSTSGPLNSTNATNTTILNNSTSTPLNSTNSTNATILYNSTATSGSLNTTNGTNSTGARLLMETRLLANTSNHQGINVTANEASNTTAENGNLGGCIRNSSSFLNGANSTTNTSTKLIKVSEVVVVQTEILSWSVCKDVMDSSVDYITEYVQRTILPKCAAIGIVYELCGTGEDCQRCFSEFDCTAQPGCGWDQQTGQCYERICADTALQCKECTDQPSCEGIGCLYSPLVGCVHGCDGCAACPQIPCNLMSTCMWDGNDASCIDIPPSPAPSTSPSASPSTSPSSAPSLAPSTAPSQTPSLSPSEAPSEAPSTASPTISTGAPTTQAPTTQAPTTASPTTSCAALLCATCAEPECNSFTGWCQWNSGSSSCEQLQCETQQCGRLICYESGVCANTSGCVWDEGSTTCSQDILFLPYARTTVSVETAAFEAVQSDLSLLSALDSVLKQEYKDYHAQLRNNEDEFVVEASFIATETIVLTLTLGTGLTLTTADIQQCADAVQLVRCGGLSSHLCQVTSSAELRRRRRLSNSDVEVVVSVVLSKGFVSEFNQLLPSDQPLATDATTFNTVLQTELTSLPHVFSSLSVSSDVTFKVETNLEESFISSSFLTRLGNAVELQSIFEDSVSATTGVTTPLLGSVVADFCADRDCSGHGTCVAGACICNTDWSQLQCNYFQGTFVSGFTVSSASLEHLQAVTQAPTVATAASYDKTFVAQPGISEKQQRGEPVATLSMDLNPAVVLQTSNFKAKITVGLWKALREDAIIAKDEAVVAVGSAPTLTRTFTFSAPTQFNTLVHGVAFLLAVRQAACGGTVKELCDVSYPPDGSMSIVFNVLYVDPDFDVPVVFPDEPEFLERLARHLQSGSSTVPASGYAFAEESVSSILTIEFFVLNDSASIEFMRRVQSVAEAHTSVTVKIKEALDWTDSLLATPGEINTDLCMNRKCSGNGECSDGLCNCSPGFFGLDCGLATRRRTQAQCSTELECAFCYDPAECDAMPLCVYDTVEELCVDASSLGNKGGFEFKSVCAVDSDSKCSSDMLQNGVCDGPCNIPSCSYDGGDCPATAHFLSFVCADLCYCNMLNDQVCNPECNNALCGFDLGDCCVKTFTKRLTRQFEVWKSSTPETVERLTPDPSVPRLRYLATTNRLIAGILLNQQRKGMTNCTTRRFQNLSKSGCFSENLSEEPYGADPGKLYCYKTLAMTPKCVNIVFLRATSLTDESLNKLAYYDINNPNEVSPLGVPYGFHHKRIDGFETDAGFPVFFDVNFGYQKGQDILSYGREGFYIDDQTSSLTIQAVTYNPHYELFASIEITLYFETGGRIRLRYDIQSIRVDMYSTVRDQKRLLAELLFVGATLFDGFMTLKELMCMRNRQAGVTGYLKSIWNYIDVLNISLMIYLSIMWLSFQTREFAAFNPEERFDVYSDIDAKARFLQFDAEEMKRMLVFFADTKKLSTLLSNYITGSACALVLLIIRILKVLDFQERMGIVTRTITNAAIDLFHWLVLFGLIFFLYVYMGFLIFGTAILSFSTVERSFQTCFGILLGEIGVTEEMFNLPNRASVYIFYYTFIMIVFFVLINVFLAIIVDAYVDVKNRAENSESLPKEVVVLSRSLLKSLPGLRLEGEGYLNDSEIIRILDEWLEEEKTLTAIPEPQGSLDLNGYHLRHDMLRGALAKEIFKLKEMRRELNATTPSRRRRSVALVNVLEKMEAEKQVVAELSAKIADNLIHRYGHGFKRLETRRNSRKVRPSIFAKASQFRYKPPDLDSSKPHVPDASAEVDGATTTTPKERGFGLRRQLADALASRTKHENQPNTRLPPLDQGTPTDVDVHRLDAVITRQRTVKSERRTIVMPQL